MLRSWYGDVAPGEAEQGAGRPPVGTEASCLYRLEFYADMVGSYISIYPEYVDQVVAYAGSYIKECAGTEVSRVLR